MPAHRAQRRARFVVSRGDDGSVHRADRLYAIPAQERDRLIIQLRRAGWTYKRIGKRVGMSESGVARAVQRIREGRFGEGMMRS